MKGRMIVVILVGVVIGLVSSSFLKQSQAQGQVKQEQQAWEYRVQPFNWNENTESQTSHVTKRASDGWEYVGLLVTGQINSQFPIGHVLFKRPKK